MADEEVRKRHPFIMLRDSLDESNKKSQHKMVTLREGSMGVVNELLSAEEVAELSDEELRYIYRASESEIRLDKALMQRLRRKIDELLAAKRLGKKDARS